MPLLNEEAVKFKGWEFLPTVEVAVPVVGRTRDPRTVAPPLTSKVEVGVVVLIPMRAVVPLPDWNTTELTMSLLVSQRGRKFAAPAPVTAAFVSGAVDSLGLLVVPPGLAWSLGSDASM